MSKEKEEKELPGPWRQIQSAIWLIGLAILAWQGWWWPGILVLVAISGLTQALIGQLSNPDDRETSPGPNARTGVARKLPELWRPN